METDLEIGLLRTFVAVARTRSFTRAAERLNRVQSAISMQIKRLEEIVGARLFERTRRSVRLTRDGEQLLHHANRLLRLNELALADLGRPSVTGRIRFGVTDTSAMYLRPILARFAEAFPLTEFEISCGRSWEALDALEAGEIDLALVTQPCGRSNGLLMRREPLQWAAAKSSTVAEQDPLPLAIFAQGCIYRRAILEALDGSGRAWRLAYNSPSRDVLRMAVETGLVVTVLPDSLLGPRLQRLGPENDLPALPEMEILLYENSAAVDRPLKMLVDVIEEVLAQPDPFAV